MFEIEATRHSATDGKLRAPHAPTSHLASTSSSSDSQRIVTRLMPVSDGVVRIRRIACQSVQCAHAQVDMTLRRAQFDILDAFRVQRYTYQVAVGWMYVIGYTVKST